ncbi:glycerate dehydrogenase, partial [Methylobacterium sp. E-041]|nr:glycerate dehydrogenase [Methylobacterium sp. E-041]
ELDLPDLNVPPPVARPSKGAMQILADQRVQKSAASVAGTPQHVC